MLDSVSINKILSRICYFVSFTESKFDLNYISTVKSTTSLVHVFKSNRMFETKHSKILKSTAKYHQIPKKNNRVRNTRIKIWKYKAVR